MNDRNHIVRPADPTDPTTVASHPVPEAWTRATLIEPTTAGFLHIAASSGPWPLPVPVPRTRRRALLRLMDQTADVLRRDPRVVRADVLRALLRPPGGDRAATGRAARDAAYDVVLLLETVTVDQAAELRDSDAVTELLARIEATGATRTLTFAGENVRRIGPVDHDRQGVFLLNYFSAGDVETNLFAWQYTAGWFQRETGLDNSTVLRPLESDGSPYTLVNHCRWDRLRDVVPALVTKRSFRTFVLKVFADNGVAPRPLFYRLHHPTR